MLDSQLTIEGDKVVIDGLQGLEREIPKALQRGLSRAAIAIYRQAYQFLSGPGAHRETKTSKTGRQYSRKIADTASGGYPVSVRTGWLRRELNWLKPGQTKEGELGQVTAGPFEAIIYDAAAYAMPIHEGIGSSAKFGPRKFITDAMELFNRGLGIQMVLRDEVHKAKVKAFRKEFESWD